MTLCRMICFLTQPPAALPWGEHQGRGARGGGGCSARAHRGPVHVLPAVDCDREDADQCQHHGEHRLGAAVWGGLRRGVRQSSGPDVTWPHARRRTRGVTRSRGLQCNVRLNPPILKTFGFHSVPRFHFGCNRFCFIGAGRLASFTKMAKALTDLPCEIISEKHPYLSARRGAVTSAFKRDPRVLARPNAMPRCLRFHHPACMCTVTASRPYRPNYGHNAASRP